MLQDENPFCLRCGYRMYPQWGPHECKQDVNVTEEEIKRTRHAAGDIISNLHFYRLPPDLQIGALSEALAFTLAGNVHPKIIDVKWAHLKEQIWTLIQTQLGRQAKGTNAENLVMDVARPRMKAKVKHGKEKAHDRRASQKADRPNRQAVSVGRTRRHGRAKGHH